MWIVVVAVVVVVVVGGGGVGVGAFGVVGVVVLLVGCLS